MLQNERNTLAVILFWGAYKYWNTFPGWNLWFSKFRWHDKFIGKLFWPVFIWNRLGRNFWFDRSAILCGRERITQAVIRFFIKWRSWWQCHCRGNCRWWLFWLVITGSVMRRWHFAEGEDTCSPLCHTEIFWQWWWDRVAVQLKKGINKVPIKGTHCTPLFGNQILFPPVGVTYLKKTLTYTIMNTSNNLS